jgi:metaxin
VLEGYKDEETRDESRAWVSLLEGDVHTALVIFLCKSTWCL